MSMGKIDKKLAGILKIYGAKTDKLRREKRTNYGGNFENGDLKNSTLLEFL
jgi:hypothetical protein